MHIAVILPRWVGDLVMTTPMLRALRTHFGDRARITGVLKPMFAELLEGTRWLDETVLYDRRSKDPSRRFRAVARRLRGMRPDVAVIVPNSLSTAALAFAGGARRRVGFARHWRRFLLTDALPPARDGFRIRPVSTAAHAMDLVERIGVPRQPLTLELATTAADENRADAALARLFPTHDPSAPLVVFNDNGAFGPAKSWGPDKFAALGRLVMEGLPDARVLVHCGPGDRAEADTIERLAALPGVRSLGREAELPFGLAKALVRRAAVVVTTDSGPRHIAAAFRRPTIVLHGPMDPRLSRSEETRLVEMRLDLPCSPCGKRTCPLGHHDCMRLLSVDDVGHALLSILRENRPSCCSS